jgi:pre-mRNA-processing factor 40
MAAGRGGRGRALTLPAWMTAGPGGTEASAALGVSPTAAAATSSNASAAAAAAAAAAAGPAVGAAPAAAATPGGLQSYPASRGMNMNANIGGTHHRPMGMGGAGTMSSMPGGPAGGYGAHGGGHRGQQPVAGRGRGFGAGSGNAPEDWTEHRAPDGRSYFFNKVTLVSTYERPACLPVLVAALPELEMQIPPCKWKEYDHNGKKYYSDGKTSLWEKPAELIRHEELVAAKARARAAEATKPASGNGAPEARGGEGRANGGSSRKRAAAAVDVDVSKFVTPEQKRAAFEELLFSSGISSAHKWAEIEKECSLDPRWTLLKKGQRRQIATEYQGKRRKEEAKEARAQARVAKEEFLKMLATNFSIDARTPWSEAEALLGSDERFLNVEDPREREEIFREFVDELGKKDREEAEKKRAEALASYSTLFADGRLGDTVITHLTRWHEVAPALERLGAVIPQVDILSEADRRGAFQGYVDTLIKAEEDRRAAERDAKLRREAEARDSFRGAVRAKFGAGELGEYSAGRLWKWRDVREIVEAMPEHAGLVGQPPMVARDVYEDVLVEQKTILRDDHRSIREALSFSQFEVQPETQLEEFQVALKTFLKGQSGGGVGGGAAAIEGKEESAAALAAQHKLRDYVTVLCQERASNVDAAFTMMVNFAKVRAEEEVRRLRALERRYQDLLEDLFYRSDHVGLSWEEAQPSLEKHGELIPRDLTAEKMQHLFGAHMEQLQRLMTEKAARLEALKLEHEAKKAAMREEGEVSGEEDGALQPGEELLVLTKGSGLVRQDRSKSSSEERGRTRRRRSPSSSRGRSRSRSASRSRSRHRSHKKHRRKEKKKHKKKHRSSRRRHSRSISDSESSRSRSRSHERRRGRSPKSVERKRQDGAEKE